MGGGSQTKQQNKKCLRESIPSRGKRFWTATRFRLVLAHDFLPRIESLANEIKKNCAGKQGIGGGGGAVFFGIRQ
jgi:hypothetical protein